jgi:hypothetical protein
MVILANVFKNTFSYDFHFPDSPLDEHISYFQLIFREYGDDVNIKMNKLLNYTML